jgi:hypothetical protein
MFCPNCKVEYRTGFIRCSDCEADLVEEPPKEGVPVDEAVTMLWECDDQTECVVVCRHLKNASIPYRVDQAPYDRDARMRVEWRYRILISPDDLGRAMELLRIDAPQNTVPTPDDNEEEVVDPTVELPDAGVPLVSEPKRRDAYLGPWYPEDATVEVWSQDGDDFSSGIALSLDANFILCRCDSDNPGAKKIFVQPEDESFAREIVREIIEGTPLK